MKKLLSQDDIKILKENPFIEEATETIVSYSPSFRNYFAKEYQTGKTPRNIIRGMGIDPDILGQRRINAIAEKSKKSIIKNNESLNLSDKSKQISLKNQLQKLLMENEYLKAENEFIKKKMELEDKLIQKSKSQNKKNLF